MLKSITMNHKIEIQYEKIRMANYIEAMWNYVYRQQEEKIKM